MRGWLARLHHLAVGDYVVVTGTLAIRSPHHEVNSAGLIIHEALAPGSSAPAPAAPIALPEPAPPPLPARVQPARVVPPAGAVASIRHASAGHRAYASPQYDTAIAEYEAALRAWSGNAAAWYIALGELYRRWHHGDEALAIAELGSAVVPGSAEIWFALGLARDDRGDPGAAIAAYGRALDLQPDLVQARFRRGQAYAHQRDAARARRDLRAVVQAGGTSFEVEQARHVLSILGDRTTITP